MGFIAKLFGGGDKPKASREPIEETEAARRKNKRSRVALFKTEGGSAGQELDPSQVTGRNTLLGNQIMGSDVLKFLSPLAFLASAARGDKDKSPAPAKAKKPVAIAKPKPRSSLIDQGAPSPFDDLENGANRSTILGNKI